MNPRHSTRLSQEHEEPEDEQGQHRTAAHDYPEMGTVLADRPDPGSVITVIGSRTAAAYGTEEDARREDYNGGEGDLGMNWAEPGEQDWMHENTGPQQEAPPPAWDPDLNPVMARLAQQVAQQSFFGARHHATDINGTHVDDHGDAPEHGTLPRAGAPDAYDDRSTEGDGDPRWSEPLPPEQHGSKKAENAATVGMYPEGISAGGGPGISVGPFTAAYDGDMARHMEQEHHFPRQTPGADEDQQRLLEQDHEDLHAYDEPGHGHPDSYEFDPHWDHGQDASGYHAFTGAHREARVPWTGAERGKLHSWHEQPTATWGDFVPSGEFLGRDTPSQGEVEERQEQDRLDPVEAAAGEEHPYWEAHLRDMHGWSDSQAGRTRGEMEQTHEALHRAGLGSHQHPGGPEEALAGDPQEQSRVNLFGHDVGITPRMRAQTRDRAGGSSRTAPSEQWAQPAPFTSPDSYRQDDPARFRRMMSALNVHVRIDGKPVVHEHDDEDNSLDSSQDKSQDNPVDKNGPDKKSSQVSGGGFADSPQDGAQANPQPGTQDDDSFAEPAKTGQGVAPGTGKQSPPGAVSGPGPGGNPDQWPSAGADVNETSRAYTQGKDDGKVTRGGAPAPFSPDDGDSGGGGDQDDDSGPDPNSSGGEEDTPFSREGALAMFTAAAASPSFRFEFTAAWNDVVAKARRIRSEGHVRIVHASAGMVIGEVRGDHDTYESGIQRPVGRRQAISSWACGCPWASFHQKAAARRSYSGRPCSHVMALQFEAQARGMFGRAFDSDAGVPDWSPSSVVVKSMPPYDGAPHRGRWTEEWRAPAARQDTVARRATAALLRSGEDPDEVGALRLLAGLRATADQANGSWGSQNVSQSPPQKPYGATSPPMKSQDPGSYGPLAAPDPDNWGSIEESPYTTPLTADSALHGAPEPALPEVTADDSAGGVSLNSMADDSLSPDGTSIQVSGGLGPEDDVVAAFQRSAAAGGYAGGPVRADGDIAASARQYLAKTADVLPAAEADALIREGRGQRARNLDLLRLEGTHYEDDAGDDDHEDDVIFA